MTVKGIEVSGTIYDNEDETARNGVNENTASIGDLADLETEEKTDLVSALNEVANKDTPVVFTCGYFQERFPPRYGDEITATQIATLIGKQPSTLAVGQGVLLQGFTQRSGATEYLPFSVFIQKTASGFSTSYAVADENVSVYAASSTFELSISNTEDSTVTLFLNVVGINAFYIIN